MALRLKKDVQKASYYVWFLGAQEAKELRGERVLLSTIPRLIERSRQQEPLKVTLQISHKGLKIIQGSAKHFIPHNAITCSIVSDDIVACVLLLYNPATKCPLHVHAYRCDSDLTANALNDQLQILIKKPENQKRFAELELKLEKSLHSIERSKPLSMPPRKESKHFESSSRRFDSSLGSDTGTSTRESECSEEQQHSPVERPAHLYDSLAAELRAKLNGNGPPLLLPPRDYDTISRSQGNLTAVDLRRCQNLSIVGKEVKSGKRKPHHVSSHGSSGIGSDLAPSPERHEEISTSSSEEWQRKHDTDDSPSAFIRKVEKIQLSTSYIDEKLSPTRYRENPPSYIFPKEPISDFKPMQKSSYRKQFSNEDDQPIVMTKQLKESYESNKKHYQEPIKSRVHVDDERKQNSGLMRQQSERYRQVNDYGQHRKYSPNSYDDYERENLTDRQKYREKYQKHPDEARVELHRMKEKQRDYSPEAIRTIQRKSRSSDRYDAHEMPVATKHKAPEDFIERNPYRESESLPYRQSIERMMKSPVMKYKSRVVRESFERRSPSPSNDVMYGRDIRKQNARNFNGSAGRRMDPPERDLYIKDSSPMSTMKRVSPKDRFQDAKEKFQAMEKIRLQQEAKPILNVRRLEPSRYDKDYRPTYSPEPRYHAQPEWSSEEEFSANNRHYRDIAPQRPTQHYHHQQQQQQRMAPAKSLGNLTKGYRHSYAEPIKYCNRVGLAAISLDPY